MAPEKKKKKAIAKLSNMNFKNSSLEITSRWLHLLSLCSLLSYVKTLHEYVSCLQSDVRGEMTGGTVAESLLCKHI